MNWRVVVYEKHIGIIDDYGYAVANVVGGRGDARAWETANFIIKAVNDYKKQEVL